MHYSGGLHTLCICQYRLYYRSSEVDASEERLTCRLCCGICNRMQVREACAGVRRVQKWREESLANFEEPLESAKAFLEHFSASTRAALKGLGEPLAFQPLAQFGDLSDLSLSPTKTKTPSPESSSVSPLRKSKPRAASPQPQKSHPLPRSPTRAAQHKSKPPPSSPPASDSSLPSMSFASSLSSSLPSWPSSTTSSSTSSSMSVGSLTSDLQSWLAPLGMGAAAAVTKPRSPKWSLDGRVVRKPATSGS